MKFFYKWIAVSWVVISCVSCASNKNTRLRNFQQMNGEFSTLSQTYNAQSNYIGKGYGTISLLSLFNIDAQTSTVDLKFISNNQVRLSYWSATDSGTFYTERIFSGKPKKKYLQIFLHKDRFNIPLIIGHNSIDRLRIGKAENGNLLVMNYFENTGYIFVLGGGGSGFYAYTFPALSSSSAPLVYYDTAIGKWGLQKGTEIYISPQYDFIQPFATSIYLASIGRKSGILTDKNDTLVPFMYDKIRPIMMSQNTAMYEVNNANLYGLLDSLGKEILPVFYDEIRFNQGYGTYLKKDNKHGFVTNDGYIIPAVFDKSFIFFTRKMERQSIELAEVQQGDEVFYIDKFGYRYDQKNLASKFSPYYVPVADSKRKMEY